MQIDLIFWQQSGRCINTWRTAACTHPIISLFVCFVLVCFVLFCLGKPREDMVLGWRKCLHFYLFFSKSRRTEHARTPPVYTHSLSRGCTLLSKPWLTAAPIPVQCNTPDAEPVHQGYDVGFEDPWQANQRVSFPGHEQSARKDDECGDALRRDAQPCTTNRAYVSRHAGCPRSSTHVR